MDYFHHYKDRVRKIGVDVYPRMAFLLLAHEVPNLVEWKKEFSIPGSWILDSHGNIVSPDEMEMIITVRSGEPSNHPFRDNIYIGTHGLRHRRVGMLGHVGYSFDHRDFYYRCIANEDCWDLCVPR